MSRQSTKNKKYALRKIGKFFGSCAVATIITLSGAAIIAPNVTVHASENGANAPKIVEGLSSSNDGYEVIIPKGKKYIRNDEIESHAPVLKEEGYNGRSFILPKEGEGDYFFDHPMSEVFTKLYDKDNDGNVDDEYKNSEPVDNSHAGETIDGATVPYRSEIDPKYPHVVDSGLTGDAENAPGVWKYNPDGKYAPSDGVINDQDTIVVARKPITVDENAEENVVKDDGSVVLSSYYRIHVNKGDHIDKKDDVYEVGTKPKVVETPIPFETRYERDDSIPKGEERETTAGVNGEKVTTTTYELNVQTGEVTANAPTSETTNPVTRVVKRGTQPQVERTPIPFETRYERDDSIPEGEEREVTAGVNGEKVTTTTYELNVQTGEVTANTPTSETTNPVTRVVKRGTQPKPGATPETPQPKPGETPETPQPKPGETPETPQPKPGATPETPQPKPGETPETPQPETGINVIPPTPRIVERSGGNTVEVEVPNKDADTLSITFTKRNSAEKETIVTKKDNGTWMIEKAPKGVTINPTNGLVYIPSKQIEPKTSVDTQTKHKYKQSKIVSVMPNILDLPKFEGTTEWIDVNGNVLKAPEKGVHEKEKFASYVWLESIFKGDKITHIYFEGTPSVDKPEYKITVWFDEDGNPIKPEKPGTHESGNIPGYRLITTATKDGITIHKFEKVVNGTPILPESPTSHPMTPSSSTPEKPNKAQTPSPEQDASPAPSKVSEQKGEAVATATSEKTVDSVTSTKTSDKAELPNTGTEANANLAALGLLGALSGFGLLARKKKED